MIYFTYICLFLFHSQIVPDESVVKTEVLEEPKDEDSTELIDADSGLAYDPLTPGMQGRQRKKKIKRKW